MVDEKEPKITKKEKVSKGGHIPEYEPPKIITYTSDEILEEIGPAQACSPDPCAVGD